MLNGGTLDGAHLEVTSTSDVEPKASVLPTGVTGSTPIGTSATSGFSQEDKPRVCEIIESETVAEITLRLLSLPNTSRTGMSWVTTSSSAPSTSTVRAFRALAIAVI